MVNRQFEIRNAELKENINLTKAELTAESNAKCNNPICKTLQH